MSGLSHLFPAPEPVSLGRWSGTAVCFRLRDLAHLETLERTLAGGDPLAGRRVALLEARAAAGGDPLGGSAASHAYAGELREAIRAVQAAGARGTGGPPASPAGKVVWLHVLLARTNEDFTMARAAEVLADRTVTAGEWLALEAVAYADHPADWLRRLMVPPSRRKAPAAEGWAGAILKAMEARSWTFEQAGDLYLSQWMALGGQTPGQIVKTKDNAGWYRAVTEMERRLLRPKAQANGTGH